jgi:tRNA(Arg) A34 adenosine deaminase TadA
MADSASEPQAVLSEFDEKYLRQAIALSASSRAKGNHPFGALLVAPTGDILLTAENRGPVDNDPTAHAERLLMTQASKTLSPQVLASATMYTSAEPCAMCAGAAYWVGIAKVVYALSETRLKAHIGPHPENLTMNLPCRTVFAAGQRPIAVVGPALEDEALAIHKDFWT